MHNCGTGSNLGSLSSYLRSYCTLLTRLLTLDPIRCTVQAALNYMNTNVFPRRPKEILDD